MTTAMYIVFILENLDFYRTVRYSDLLNAISARFNKFLSRVRFRGIKNRVGRAVPTVGRRDGRKLVGSARIVEMA